MKRLLQKIVDVRANELHALGLAFVFNFVVLGSYYVVRPIRDDIAATGGIETLPWMYTGTLVTMLVANALFSAIVARMSRRRFIPIAYRFFMANLVIFYVLMHTLTPAQNVWVGRAFYVWVSVFNLFVVTLFWAFMTDVFNSEQAKRLFAFISVGGSIGAIVGPIITVTLVHRTGRREFNSRYGSDARSGSLVREVFFPLNLLGILSVSRGIPSRRPQSLHHRIPRLHFALLGMTEPRRSQSAVEFLPESHMLSARLICSAFADLCFFTPLRRRFLTFSKPRSPDINFKTGMRAPRFLRNSIWW